MKTKKKRVLVCDVHGCYHHRVGAGVWEGLPTGFEPDTATDLVLVKSQRYRRGGRGFVVAGFLALWAWGSVVLSWVN